MAYYQCLVAGLSIAGISAVEHLIAAGHPVALVEVGGDSPLADIPEIRLVNDRSMANAGEEYASEAWVKLSRAGVILPGGCLVPTEVAPTNRLEALRIRDIDGGEVTVRALIFAPNGSEPGLPKELEAEKLMGWGVSYSVSADVSFYAGKPVCVYGSGERAIEEAILASRTASRVYLLCPTVLPSRLLAKIRLQHQIEILAPVEVSRLLADPDGSLRAIEIVDTSMVRVLEVEGLFAAQDLVPPWTLLGGEDRAKELVEHGLVILAGMARGAPYWDHEALRASGVEAAEEYLFKERKI